MADRVYRSLPQRPLSIQYATIRSLLRLIGRRGHPWFPILDGREAPVGVVTYSEALTHPKVLCRPPILLPLIRKTQAE